ncbi:MAG TPA: diacylglycerol kinase family lipid kinase [Candidatus Intestinimonas stercoravium]|uniref:diacylglycerol/lipid kinase family protein n=1 Tax=uncultured Intestinimonas sp. TaxID=1689265 RepID=UPI001F963A32|nr:diacylglycerol kinase family protein [uncultured Intestinimonas sp.]HJA63509.1 diacylglycerol kinase family lipid kinase [Candidatus Intestinimonas stercoravium]
MKRLLFIYNPQAGKGTVKAHLSNIVDTFTKAGYLVTIWPTQGKEDATHVAAQQGWWYDRVVCCGGDGTLSETVSGLLALDTPPVLGYIPAGTTNDFSKNLGLPRGVEKAAVTAVEGEARPCDMGRFNGRYFVYVAAFGIFTDVSYGTPQQFKNAFGHLAYVLEGATKLGDLGRAYHLQVEHDEGSLEGDFIYGMVTNTLSVGGFKVFPPKQVSLDDGLFEVVLVRQPRNVADLQDALFSLVRQDANSSRLVEAFHTRKLKVTAAEPLPWTLDGEFGGDPETAVIENLHDAITLVWGK